MALDEQNSMKQKTGGSTLKQTASVLIGLIGGLALGLIVHRWPHPASLAFTSAVEPVGELWMNALRMTIIPLIVSQLICGIAAKADAKTVGKLGGLSLLTFIALLIVGAIFAVIAAPPLAALFKVDQQTLAALQSGASGLSKPEAGSPASFGAWVVALVPSNPIKAAADGALLPLIVSTALFALAITRLADEHRRILLGFFQALSQTMFTLVRWVMKFMPLGVFALALPMTAKIGGVTIGALVYFVVLVCALLLGFTLLLYPIAMIVGRVNLWRFARATTPAQAVAVGSSSSIASLPALLDGARRWLVLPDAVTGFVLPLSVSVFKVNRTVSSLAKLFFIAHLYGFTPSLLQIVTFTLTVMLLSFSAPGIPGGSPSTSLPAYLAAGAPIEAYILFEAVDAIPDIFKTLVNVTGNMTALTIVARLAGFSDSADSYETITGAKPRPVFKNERIESEISAD
ncbi:MAG: dicarboxylate/amino acid:cation symporter [Blastocatellales bacterium]